LHGFLLDYELFDHKPAGVYYAVLPLALLQAGRVTVFAVAII
jgi:hypothetical protein